MMNRRGILASGAGALIAGLAGTARAGKIDVVAELGASAQFLTLVDALFAADLVVPLKGRGPFTIFAPDEWAFARIPRRTLDHLMSPAGQPQLASLLTYHVVPGYVSAFELNGRRTALTAVGNRQLVVDGTRSGLRIGSAYVGLAEIEASNGIIHQVDRVLMPV